MAVQRERPYSRFNFLVTLGDGDSGSVQAGFSEVTGLDIDVQPIEYRAGNFPTNRPIKLPGLSKVGNVTLRRGVIGVLDLSDWLKQASEGDQDVYRNVVIELLAEDRQTVALSWRLRNAWPIRYDGPDLSAATNDIAIEELVLSCESIDVV